MKQVRSGVFETNSSSTHSLTICTEEEFNKWKNGELMFDYYNDCFAEKIKLTDYDKKEAKEYYEDVKGAYWKDWSQLSDEEIQAWYDKYANDHLRDKKAYNLKTYKEWYENHYDNLEKYEYRYTSPSGDKIVAFGKYGYN